jgi:hypothetical protein
VPRIAHYLEAQLSGNVPVVDLSETKPASSLALGTSVGTPKCYDNNGQGYGPRFVCPTGKCAKLTADLAQDCTITPNWGGRRYCTANQGRGYGDVFLCNGLRCAKADEALHDECVLLDFIPG